MYETPHSGRGRLLFAIVFQSLISVRQPVGEHMGRTLPGNAPFTVSSPRLRASDRPGAQPMG